MEINERSESIKNFYCNDCNRSVNCLRWKEISKSINKGSQFKCDECWEKFDKLFDKFCLDSMKCDLAI